MVFTNKNKFSPEQKALIIGGGPTGLFAALKILESIPNSSVKIMEKRPVINRPQVINAAFEGMDSLPDKVKVRLWPDERTRENVYGAHSKLEPGFWPYTEYKHLSLFQIGEFQKAILDYIEETYGQERFSIDIHEKITIENIQKCINDYDICLVATGNCELAKELRREMKIFDFHTENKEEIDTRAIYLLFEADKREPYERKGKLVTRASLASNGVTYGHSNDSSNHVQMYSFPFGGLKEIFQAMPESFKQTAAYPTSHLTFDGKLDKTHEITAEEKEWFEVYREEIKSFMRRFDIPHPSDDKIRVFYANREEYYYEKAGATFLNVPVLYVGDSCGATDFRLGLGLGRGLLIVLNISKEMALQQKLAFDGIIDHHNRYWQNVLDTEFNKKNHNLTKTPEITFKYFMMGRVVDGVRIGWEQREAFIKEVKRIEKLKDKIKGFVITKNPQAIKF